MPLLFINHKDPDKPRFAAEAFAPQFTGCCQRSQTAIQISLFLQISIIGLDVQDLFRQLHILVCRRLYSL